MASASAGAPVAYNAGPAYAYAAHAPALAYRSAPAYSYAAPAAVAYSAPAYAHAPVVRLMLIIKRLLMILIYLL